MDIKYDISLSGVVDILLMMFAFSVQGEPSLPQDVHIF